MRAKRWVRWQDTGTTSGGGTARGRDEAGYVLVAALLALLAVSVLSTAGFVATRSDGRISANHRSTVEAREIARAGLSRYLATNRSPSSVETYAFGGDTAFLRARPLVDVDGDRRLYRLTSRGVAIRRRGGRVERRLEAVVLHDRGVVSPAGAVGAGAPIRIPGDGEATVDGFDACPSPGAAVAGVAVPSTGFDGDPSGVDGDPPVDESRSARAVLEASGIDSTRWAGVTDGSLVTADHTVPPEAWPSDFSDWPVVLVDGSAVLGGPESGRGTLVVTGELALDGAFAWDGLVLVGGGLTAGGEAGIDGAVLAGLDRLHGARPDTSVLSGSAGLQYHSCKLLEASRRAFEHLAQRPGTRYEVIGG